MEVDVINKYKKQLENWISGGKKLNFCLLYKASRDGCSPEAFHDKCDGRGPTVTILHAVGNTIVGGYTSISWHSKNTFSKDHNAFLFALNINGTTEKMKYAIKKQDKAIYGYSKYGPTFGNGYDLHTMGGKITKNKNGCFQLNGYTKIGDSYDVKDQNHEAFSNDKLLVFDLEVFRVKDAPRLEEPWRKIEWDDQVFEFTKESIVKYQPCEQLQVPQTRILLLGPIGAGKSSFINTVSSIFTGYITSQANSGSASKSLTRAFRSYLVRNGLSKKPMHFRLCDTPGLEDDKHDDFSADDFEYILDGHVPDNYQFSSTKALSPAIPGWVKSPTLADKIHCVAIVVPCTQFGIDSKARFRKIKELQSKLNERGIPQVVLLTKIDEKCELVYDDVSEVIFSPTVFNIMEIASKVLGLPRSQILPIKNYESETELDRNVNLLTLFSLRQILQYADGYFLNCLDTTSVDNEKNYIKDLTHLAE